MSKIIQREKTYLAHPPSTGRQRGATIPDPISPILISTDITTDGGLTCLSENELRISIGYTVRQKEN